MVTLEEAQQNAYQAWVRHLRFVEREYQQQPVPDDQLPDRYEQYLSLEAVRAARERERWRRANWGYPSATVWGPPELHYRPPAPVIIYLQGPQNATPRPVSPPETTCRPEKAKQGPSLASGTIPDRPKR